MLVIVKVTLWDIEGDRYVGSDSNGPCLVDDPLLATEFDLCGRAWDAFAKLKGLGNIKAACLEQPCPINWSMTIEGD